MIRSVEIKRLRGIREGKLEDLTPLVVLVGPNGSGKSTILDAILIAANPSPATGVGHAVVRREGVVQGWNWLFWKTDSPQASIEVRTDAHVVRECKIQLPGRDLREIKSTVVEKSPRGHQSSPAGGTSFDDKNSFSISGSQLAPLSDVPEVAFIGPFPRTKLFPLHELYSGLVRKGAREQALAIIRDIVPGQPDFEVLTENDKPVLNLVFADRAVPVSLAGDGIALLTRIVFELATRAGGVVLMEEPELHQHPGALRQTAKVIVAAVRRNIQVILTTHSLELIDCLLAESNDADLERMSLYRLALHDGTLQSSRVDGRDVAFSRRTIEDDLR